MRHVAASFLLTLGIAGATALAGCSSGPWSPSDPKTFDRTMFDESAVAGLSGDAQPFVMGHAIGVYLLGKTLPSRVADHHYYYRPGKSSPFTQVAYDWESVMVARSGGSDGNGGAIYDDVGIGDPANHEPLPNGPSESEPPAPGTPSDDVGEGNPDDPNDGGNHEGECGVIDAVCDSFLKPAVVDASKLAALVDARKFAPAGVTGADLDHFVTVFQEGVQRALDEAAADPDAEVGYVKHEAQVYGLCYR